MKFFSGFCLSDESELFINFLDNSDYCVAGFSLGAIRAIEYVSNSKSRVDKLQLFSPSFFQDKDEKYKRVQLLHFKKDEKNYVANFLKNISYPSQLDMSAYYKKDSIEELKKLLDHVYSESILIKLKKRGIEIEVYIGEYDMIIDHKKVKEFFDSFATIYILKNRGHILNG
jgi:phosphatidylserine/phosphatidylglycerophosphate/cardiolipin synthase-like enzyme